MPDAADGHGPGRAATRTTNGTTISPGAARRPAERPRLSAQQQAERRSSARTRPADRVRGWRDSAGRTARRLTGAGQGADRADDHHHHDHEDDHGATMAARSRPRGRPYSRSLELDVDWRRARVFAVGLTAGALLGAGVALLMAPQSGSRTRRQLADAGRRAGTRAADAWDGLGDELRVARARARRDVRRGLRSGRREAVDAWTDLDRRALRGLRNIRQWRAERDRRRAHEGERAGRG